MSASEKLRLSDEEFDRLKTEHGDVIGVETCMGTAVFRAPREGEGDRYKQMLYDNKLQSKAVDTLARACVVHPSRQVFGKWCDEKPMLAHDCAPALNEIMGMSGGAIVKR